jgi:EAL domain-containing protein (putative c-di-GMP-specific phosphodiesterase class I)
MGWLMLREAGFAMPLSVNVSPSQFRQTDFVAQVRAILQETGAPASAMIFEVTEGLLIENLDDTIGRMHELAALGIRLSIDDFGTGYSSLSYLKRMPLYELKIDKTFIRDTPTDANGTAIVQSILAMASHLGLSVVAEGVETREQADFLAANGAPRMQGYLFARPMPLEQMLARLSATGPQLLNEVVETVLG